MKNKKIIIFLLVIVVILGILSYLIFNHLGLNRRVAEIYKDNKLLYSIDLSRVKESYEIEVNDEDSHYNLIKVEKNRISVIEADCNDKVCVNYGTIENGVIPIVCLPNKLLIKIVEEKEGYEIDGKIF